MQQSKDSTSNHLVPLFLIITNNCEQQEKKSMFDHQLTFGQRSPSFKIDILHTFQNRYELNHTVGALVSALTQCNV